MPQSTFQFSASPSCPPHLGHFLLCSPQLEARTGALLVFFCFDHKSRLVNLQSSHIDKRICSALLSHLLAVELSFCFFSSSTMNKFFSTGSRGGISIEEMPKNIWQSISKKRQLQDRETQIAIYGSISSIRAPAAASSFSIRAFFSSSYRKTGIATDMAATA